MSASAGPRRLTLVLAVLTVLTLSLSVPASLRDAWERGGFYLFSREFDPVWQWLILGASYPGAALLVGPVLIAFPYAVARALANRVTTARGRPS